MTPWFNLPYSAYLNVIITKIPTTKVTVPSIITHKMKIQFIPPVSELNKLINFLSIMTSSEFLLYSKFKLL